MTESLIRVDIDAANLQSFIDILPSAVFIHDLDGRIKFANGLAEKYTGYTKEEILSIKVRDLDPFSASSRNLPKLWEELLRGMGEVLESYHFRKDGSKYYAQISLSGIKISGIPYIMGVVTDLTRFKDVENSLIESERIFNYALDMICVVGFDGYFKTLNPSWEKTLGWSIKELKSRQWLEFVHPDDSDNCIIRRGKIIEKGEMLQFENRYICKDGTYKWLNWSCHPFPDEEVMYGIARDVTERKRYQEEAAHNEKMKSMGILAAGIAHDFNNLLASLYGNIEMANKNSGVKEKVEYYLDSAFESFNIAKSLAAQLLTFSKGGEPVKKVDNIVESVMYSCNFALSGSKVACEYDIDPELKPVSYDHEQISQVIQNMVVNSIQAMRDGGIIGISLHNEKNDKGDFVKITIADSGDGISKENLKNIFDPFFTTKDGGSGLGLPISYSVVQKHRGYIEVESQVGTGTAFHIFLPVSDQNFDDKKETDNLKSFDKRISGTILVMDDQDAVRDIMKDMIESLGYEVIEANDGEHAVTIIEEMKIKGELIRCAIFDLTVPGGMGGKDAIKKVKEIMPDLPVFASSGYSSDPVMADPKRFGFAARLKKPFKLKDISEIIEEFTG